MWKKSNSPVVQTNPSRTLDIYHRDPSGLRRELSPEFGGTGGREWGADLYIRTICHVCRLQLFPEKGNPSFPAAKFPDQIQYNTPGGLSLCKRHYDLVNALIERKVTIDKWPTQLIRGIVTFAKAYLQAGNDGVAVSQRELGSIQTTKSVITPAPIFGNTYNPVSTFGGTGTFSYDFLIFPMQRQVVDQNAVREAEWSRQYLQFSQERVQIFGQQVAKYSELLERLRKENPPKFVTCLRCGQSEMPLGTKVCTWCGQSQGYTGEAVPASCLVEDVDPLNVVPAYTDRTGTVFLNRAGGSKSTGSHLKNDDNEKKDKQGRKDVNMNKSKENVFCINCGTKISNPNSRFCDSCGSPVEEKKIQGSTLSRDTKSDPKSSNQEKSSNEKATNPANDNTESIKRDTEVPKKETNIHVNSSDTLADGSRSQPSKDDFIKFCPECGKKLLFENPKFCPNCGSPLKTKMQD
jgi:ribosomal protein L37E